MSTLTLVRDGRRALFPGKCAQHPRYIAGCPDCQANNRIRRRAVYRAQAYGTHQPGNLPAIGAARRLQGLAVDGWEAVDLAPMLATHPDQVRRWRAHDRPTISRRRHEDITALANRLATIPGPSRRARTIANREGWAPLAAWDDIDDPDDVPQVRDERHHDDPQTLITRVLAGKAPIDVLTPAEQARLWRRWADRRTQAGLYPGDKTFAREFAVSPHRARRLRGITTTTTSNFKENAA